MEFIIMLLTGAFINASVIATNTMEDCKKREFRPDACKVAKTFNDLGK